MYYLVRWKDNYHKWDVIIEGRSPHKAKVVEQLLMAYTGKGMTTRKWLKGADYNLSTDLTHIEKMVAKDKSIEKLKEKYYMELL